MVWEPQPGRQSAAIDARFVEELFYGGARGGGKSDFLLGDYLQDVNLGPAWRGILFRRSYPELEELLTRAKEIYFEYGAEYSSRYRTFTFPSGATLKMRFLETDKDADNYQGHQYTWIGWDELTNWPNLGMYNKLKACLRSASGDIPFKRIRAGGNPGGRGHNHIKQYFVDPYPAGMQLIEGKRMFIPSLLQDNKILMRNDPGYMDRLRSMATPDLIRAWLEGDWNVVAGAFFPEFETQRHVIRPFSIPYHWMRFRAMDWGSAYPYAVYWFAVADGNAVEDMPALPRGALVVYRELYGASGYNKGLQQTAEQVGQRIAASERQDPRMSYAVLDPSAFKRDGGPSNAEKMRNEGAAFRKADNTRIAGWDTLRARLRGSDLHDNQPMIYFFDTCPHILRTLPALQADKDFPEDTADNQEDHGPDAIRYGCQSRPFVVGKSASPLQRPKTVGEIFDMDRPQAVKRFEL